MDDHLVAVRITGGAPDIARVTARRQQFAVGRPMEFDEAAPRIAALEYALGAAGAEIVNGLRVFAERRRLDIDAIEATVVAYLEHALAYLEVVGESEGMIRKAGNRFSEKPVPGTDPGDQGERRQRQLPGRRRPHR